MGLMFLFDICRFRGGEIAHYLGILEITDTEGIAGVPEKNSVMLILVPLTAATMLFNLSKFKNRTLQRKLCRLTFLLLLGVIVSMYFFITANQIAIEEKTVIGYGYSSAAPIAVFVLNFLAMRGIHKDEKLINSLDRLR